jgi:hypothetical protein
LHIFLCCENNRRKRTSVEDEGSDMPMSKKPIGASAGASAGAGDGDGGGGSGY